VRVDERPERCSSSIENVSAYVVTVITVFEDRAATLVSTYLANLAGETAVSHMRLSPGRRASFAQRVLAGLPGQSHPRACLLDHAAELRAVLAELDERGGVAVVDVEDRALLLAPASSRTPPSRRSRALVSGRRWALRGGLRRGNVRGSPARPLWRRRGGDRAFWVA
jgi:hypothetical protein